MSALKQTNQNYEKNRQRGLFSQKTKRVAWKSKSRYTT